MDKHLEDRLKAIEEQLQSFQQAMEGMGRDLHRPVSALRDGYYEAALTNAGSIIEAMLRDVWVKEKISGKADAKTIEQLFSVVKEQASMDRIVVDYVRDIQLVRNRAAHGEQVTVEDCIECLRKLAIVLDWYFKKYAAPAKGVPLPPAAEAAAPARKNSMAWKGPACVALVLLAAACAWWGWHHWHGKQPVKAPANPSAKPRPQEQKLVILVAPFWGQTTEALEEGRVMQALVERKLQETLGQESDVTILGKEIQEVPKSLAEAREMGKKVKATTAVWGEVLVLGKEMEVKYYVLSDMYGQRQSATVSFFNNLSSPGRLAASEKKAEEVGNLALFTASYYYRARGDKEKAIVLLKRISPQTVLSLSDQANNYANLGRWEPAEKALAEAMKLDPKSSSPHIQRAVLLVKERKLEEAAVEAQKAVDLEPGKSSAYSMLGTVCFELQEDDKAKGALNRAIEIDPENGDAHGVLAQIYLKENKQDEAVESFKKAISCEPDYPNWHGLLAKAYLDQGKPEDAVAEYRKATELDPTSRMFVSQYAQALHKTGRDGEAVPAVDKAIATDPSNGFWHGLLAGVYAAQGKPDEAAAEHGKAAELDPKQKRAYSFLCALSLHGAGRDREAVPVLDRIIASGQGTVYDHLWLYIMEAASAGPQQARARIKGYAATLKGDDWINPVARFYAGELSEDAVLKAAEDPDPKKATEQKCEAYYYVGMQNLFDGEKTKAKDFFRKCIATGAANMDEYDRARLELDRMNGKKS